MIKYNNGQYISKLLMDQGKEKELIIGIMIDMNVNGKMIKKKEKVYIILKVVIDMMIIW